MTERTAVSCPVCGADEPTDELVVRDHIGLEPFTAARCGRCGARYIADPPPESEIGSYYETTAGAAMHQEPGKLFATMRDRRIGADLAPLLERLPAGSVVADVGTGDGSLARVLTRSGYAALGLDVYPEADWGDASIPYRQI